MQDIMLLALFGLGVGSVDVLLGQSLILVYRGSGVVNFAHGGMAMLGAFRYADLVD